MFNVSMNKDIIHISSQKATSPMCVTNPIELSPPSPQHTHIEHESLSSPSYIQSLLVIVKSGKLYLTLISPWSKVPPQMTSYVTLWTKLHLPAPTATYCGLFTRILVCTKDKIAKWCAHGKCLRAVSLCGLLSLINF